MGERNRELHELMMQIKSGDECAFQRLMNIMTPGLITLGLAYLKNAHDVEDWHKLIVRTAEEFEKSGIYVHTQ